VARGARLFPGNHMLDEPNVRVRGCVGATDPTRRMPAHVCVCVCGLAGLEHYTCTAPDLYTIRIAIYRSIPAWLSGRLVVLGSWDHHELANAKSHQGRASISLRSDALDKAGQAGTAPPGPRPPKFGVLGSTRCEQNTLCRVRPVQPH
jgi:hypothetical protein